MKSSDGRPEPQRLVADRSGVVTVRPRPPRGAQAKPVAKKGGWRHPFRIERQGDGLAYVWHGMRFGTWMKLLAEGRFDITFNCLPASCR